MLVGLSQTLDHILKLRAAEISKAMAQTCPEMDDRCRKNYAVLISLAEKVIERSEIENLDPQLALTFFKKKVYPNAVRVYQVEQETESEAKLPASGEPLLVDLLVRCIEVYKIPVKQVL
ncbi:uncharacterized protein [Montipora capricornis]|uniref:uncharacterized protein n=1 Tax=Montipora capricornis TaxID=246305 RepID=UPI0035F1C45E